jgi:hypothetical protein
LMPLCTRLLMMDCTSDVAHLLKVCNPLCTHLIDNARPKQKASINIWGKTKNFFHPSSRFKYLTRLCQKFVV